MTRTSSEQAKRNNRFVLDSAIGGQDVRTTTDRMKDGCHILSATTGRLKDIVEKGRVSLSSVFVFVFNLLRSKVQLNFVQYLVLDEADR